MAQSKAFTDASHSLNELFHALTLLESENSSLRGAVDGFTSENAKLRELVEDMLDCIEIRAAWHRPPTEEMYEEFAQRSRELGIEVD